jgi:hypothetical protein
MPQEKLCVPQLRTGNNRQRSVVPKETSALDADA